ncbi:AAA family ATPase [Granulicella sp. dw_53]|uniref:ATP-binding protein n=1 Tax=Granulicella sp. dw_53 TaxID=2719792 RepID=UPI001BD69E73|nr:AAA family ATPase [Granulicella sp. dw_53]
MSAAALDVQQTDLVTALDRVYAALASSTNHGINPDAAESHADLSSPLGHLVRTFSLSPFERDVLLLCAGFDLESRFASACAIQQPELSNPSPTFGLALATLSSPHWSALSTDGPLRKWSLIHVDTSAGLLRGALRIDERILHFLMRTPASDSFLQFRVRPMLPVLVSASEAYAPLVSLALRAWTIIPGTTQASKPLLLIGRCADDRQQLLQQIGDAGDLHPFQIDAFDLPSSPHERDQLARAWTREAALTRAVLYIRTDGTEASDTSRSTATIASFIALLQTPVAIEVREGSDLEQLKAIRLNVPPLDGTQRRSLWLQTLGPFASQMNGSFDSMVDAFALNASSIHAAAALVQDALLLEEASAQEIFHVVWTACRTQARRSLNGLAQRIETKAVWQDLILPDAQLEILRQIVTQVRHRSIVQNTWGFSAKYSRGSGMAALFAGPSGTGKTMAAEVVANELSLDLYHIDLSSVVSKYIGETEKNLRRIFDTADESGAILLFDEADALFGKRSEVRDSHDRYANLEISYLLQRMESYRGVAILTTNMKQALDTAFLRRIRFIVQFLFPEALQRERIWQHIFPAKAPLAQLNYKRLAQLNIPGGIIRNIATGAAFLAADENSSIGMDHILRASRTEYAKLEKPLTPSEIGGWE